MHEIHSRWRKPKKKISEKRREHLRLAAKARWEARARANTETQPQPTPSTSRQSTTSRKIGYFRGNEEELTSGEEEEEFIIIHRSTLQLITKDLKCYECDDGTVTILTRNNQGFAKTLLVQCDSCGHTFGKGESSPRIEDAKSTRPPFKVNRKMVEAFISIGAGYAAMERFGLDLGIKVLSSAAFFNHLKQIEEHSEQLAEEVLVKAHQIVREVRGAGEDEVIDVAVSFDGTWQKRGHTSLNGAAFVIDIETGLVLDYVVLSKYCHVCTLKASIMETDSVEYQAWVKEHKASQECQINFEGSSGSMETKAAEIIWKRSIDKCKLRYTTVLSDGDAKTYAHICQLNVYGPDVKIEKEECVNHIAKRMGTGLRNVVQEWKAKKITLGGRGEGTLKETTIVKLTSYYRNAIVKNIPNVDAMKRAIIATLDHCSSSDEVPKHQSCPEGADSWCFYNKALAKKEKPKSHSEISLKLSALVAEKVRPIYERLSNTNLLERCCRGGTQNSNESLHSLVWNFCSKEVFVSRSRLQVAVIKAISEFNMGCSNTLRLRSKTALTIPTAAQSVARRRDKRRIQRSDQQQDISRKRTLKKKKNASQTKKGPKNEDYKPGGF